MLVISYYNLYHGQEDKRKRQKESKIKEIKTTGETCVSPVCADRDSCSERVDF